MRVSQRGEETGVIGASLAFRRYVISPDNGQPHARLDDFAVLNGKEIAMAKLTITSPPGSVPRIRLPLASIASDRRASRRS